jgi:hypothetical protein
MAERYTVVEQEKINYRGLFDLNEMTKIIEKWLRNKGFDKRVLVDEEHVYEKHKYIHFKWQPYKKITDYIKFELRIWIYVTNLTTVTKEIDGIKKKMNHADMDIIIDGFLFTDYENRWEQRPMYFFIRTVFDKFLYKMQTAKHESMLREWCFELKAELSSFLNLYRFY